jgi:heme/copper-type cytochrome/quinol oxidase subunit 3
VSTAAHAGGGHHAASYGETEQLIERRQRLAVVLLIGADAVFALMLIFTYFYLRGLNVNDGWLPSGVQTMSSATTWAITAIVVLSAASYAWGVSGANPARVRVGTVIGLLLLLADLVIQVLQLASVPYHSTSGAYASGFIVFAGYHVAHLLLALFLGVGVLVRTSREMSGSSYRNQLRLVEYAWIWVAGAAVLFAITLMFTGPVHTPGV